VVHRDRHAALFSALALLASSIERFATEVRHLQRTEVRELEEPFSVGQKGSSAMPHKRNPILTENLCGLARLVRGYSDAAMENIALWQERDISHSSVERVIAPDACIVVDFMLHRFTTVVRGMVIYPERIKQNIALTRGLVFSGSLLTALVDHGIGRDDAYKIVQGHALAAWDGGPDLESRARADTAITAKVPAAALDEVFEISRHIKHVDHIFDRAFATGGRG
jgi:adenylosuccinate lyase